MNKTRVLSFAAFMLSAYFGWQCAPRWVDDHSYADQIHHAKHGFLATTLFVIDDAAKTHPVPAIRSQMKLLDDNLDSGEWILEVVYDLHGPDRSIYCRVKDDAATGKPVIRCNIATFAEPLLVLDSLYGPEKSNMLQSEAMILVLFHEMYHIGEAHQCTVAIGHETNVRQEADAWHYTVEQGIIPSRDAGRMTDYVLPTFAFMMMAHLAADGDPDSEIWLNAVRAFMSGEDLTPILAELFLKTLENE